MKTDSILTARCKRCKYSFKVPAGDKLYLCDYINKTGEPRGCEIDDNCTRFESKRKKAKK